MGNVLRATQEWTPSVQACDEYLGNRTGCYEYRKIRYGAAASKMHELGLNDDQIIFDIGAGWTEFDYYMRSSIGWRGRYVPIDGWIDGTDLNTWHPRREVDWFVALEILEHLRTPSMLMSQLKLNNSKGIIVSVPNPRTTDVIGMDPTHVTIITRQMLEDWGFTVEERTFYGQENDSLFAWRLA